MKTLKYLNVILTVLTLLLGMELWTQWTGPAHQEDWMVPSAQAAPNPAIMRKQMVDLLKQLVVQTDELTGLFRTGQARVKVDKPVRQKPSSQ